VFASHILTQNAAIAAGTLPSSTTAINLVALGLNDGVFDPAIWYRSMIDYSANNPYRVLANSSLVSELIAYYDAECAPRIAACYATDSNVDCYGGMGPCQGIINKVTAANTAAGVLFSKNDVRQPADGLSPPETYAAYLYREDVQRAIGARKNYTLRAIDVLVNVTGSGDCEFEPCPCIDGLHTALNFDLSVEAGTCCPASNTLVHANVRCIG